MHDSSVPATIVRSMTQGPKPSLAAVLSATPLRQFGTRCRLKWPLILTPCFYLLLNVTSKLTFIDCHSNRSHVAVIIFPGPWVIHWRVIFDGSPNHAPLEACLGDGVESFSVDALVLRRDCFKINGDAHIGYCQLQRRSPRSVVSGDLRLMPIFDWVRWWCKMCMRSSKMRVFSFNRYNPSVWSSPLALHIEIYRASRGFLAIARLLF